MALITERYKDKIDSVLTCYDRVLVQGCIPQWSFSEGMTRYIGSKGIMVFKYKEEFAQPLTKAVRENAEQIAADNGIEIEFIRKVGAFRKDDRIEEIIKEKRLPADWCIFSQQWKDAIPTILGTTNKLIRPT